MKNRSFSHALKAAGSVFVLFASVAVQAEVRPALQNAPASPAPRPQANPAPSVPAASMPRRVDSPAVAPPVSGGEGIRVLLAPARETTLVSTMIGQVTYLPNSIGTTVRQGEKIAQFDCREQGAKLKMAMAELDGAQETLEGKQRLRSLDAAGDTEVKLAESARDRTRAQVEAAKTMMSICTVSAPFSGTVTKLHAFRYQGVNIGTPLLDFASNEPPRLRLHAPSKWLVWLKKGYRFEVMIDETGKSYQAQVLSLNGKVDAVSQTIELEAGVVGRYSELLPGMSGTATFPNAR